MARGISTGGDVIRATVDGVDIGSLWAEFAATLTLRNQARDNLRALLGFTTTAAGDQVAQTTSLDDFELASEFGVPKALRTGGEILTLGFNFAWFDAGTRFTWKFLVDADAGQVEAVHSAALEADNRLVFKAMMGGLLNPAPRLNPEGLAVRGLYSADSTVPPEYAGVSFDGTHTHYLVSGAAALDAGDIVDATRHLQHHGHGDPSQGGRVVVFMNPVEAEAVRNFGPASKPDLIPSASAPAYLTDLTIVGDRPPANLGRIPIYGSLGSAWLSENPLIPQGYLVAVSVYGENDQRNCLAFREHVRPELRGLRQIPGGNGTYPLQDSYYSRGFGTGVRQRGGAVVTQIKAAGVYETPAPYTSVLA